MDLPELLNLIQATIVSVVMISSSALICLIIQNRYGRIVDRLRKLISDQRELRQIRNSKSTQILDEKLIFGRLQNIDVQIELLLNRGLKLKRALLLNFSAVFAFIFTSFLILVGSILFPTIVITLVAMAFFCGMFLLLIGTILTVNEIANSYDAISKEVKFARFEFSDK
jgi:ABC-type multidrug transport system fused ATPase/permease subunit